MSAKKPKITSAEKKYIQFLKDVIEGKELQTDEE